MTAPDRDSAALPLNGPAAAALVAGAAGAFAMGMLALVNELGVFTAPTLYRPSGGVTGRTTLALIVWMGVWWALHYQWRSKDLEMRRIAAVTLILIGLGVVAAFPGTWRVLVGG